jgi:hypothetical protein
MLLFLVLQQYTIVEIFQDQREKQVERNAAKLTQKHSYILETFKEQVTEMLSDYLER